MDWVEARVMGKLVAEEAQQALGAVWAAEAALLQAPTWDRSSTCPFGWAALPNGL